MECPVEQVLIEDFEYLRTVAIQAAIEIDNIKLGRSAANIAISRLIEWIDGHMPPIGKIVIDREDRNEVIAFLHALQDSDIAPTTDTVEEIGIETAKLRQALTAIVQNPAKDTFSQKEFKKLGAFCVQLSKGASHMLSA